MASSTRATDAMAGPQREGPMAESDWQPLPTPMWPAAAAPTDAGEFMRLVFTQDGVPTWEVGGRSVRRDLVAIGTADTSRRPRRLRCSQHPRRAT